MSEVITFLSNGGFSKFIWSAIILACVIAAIVVISIQIVHGQTPNAFLLNIIAGALAHGMTVGGSVVASSHQGVQVHGTPTQPTNVTVSNATN